MNNDICILIIELFQLPMDNNLQDTARLTCVDEAGTTHGSDDWQMPYLKGSALLLCESTKTFPLFTDGLTTSVHCLCIEIAQRPVACKGNVSFIPSSREIKRCNKITKSSRIHIPIQSTTDPSTLELQKLHSVRNKIWRRKLLSLFTAQETQQWKGEKNEYCPKTRLLEGSGLIL